MNFADPGKESIALLYLLWSLQPAVMDLKITETNDDDTPCSESDPLPSDTTPWDSGGPEEPLDSGGPEEPLDSEEPSDSTFASPPATALSPRPFIMLYFDISFQW